MKTSRFPATLPAPPAPADIPDDRDSPDDEPHPFRYRVDSDACDVTRDPRHMRRASFTSLHSRLVSFARVGACPRVRVRTSLNFDPVSANFANIRPPRGRENAGDLGAEPALTLATFVAMTHPIIPTEVTMRWIVPLLLVFAPAQAAIAGPMQGMSYIYFPGSGSSTSMSGSVDDLRLAERYRAGGGALLFVREGGTAYVIRDAALMRRAEAIMAPQQELGRRQGVLGRQQGELGRRQGRLGAEQGRLGAQMANSTPRQMAELGRRQADLGRQQGELGRQQGELGRRQGELGAEQGRLARLAQPQFRALVDEAIRRGVAQRVD